MQPTLKNGNTHCYNAHSNNTTPSHFIKLEPSENPCVCHTSLKLTATINNTHVPSKSVNLSNIKCDYYIFTFTIAHNKIKICWLLIVPNDGQHKRWGMFVSFFCVLCEFVNVKVHADELCTSNKQQKFIAISENDHIIFEYFGIKYMQNGVEWCVNHTKRTSIGWEKIGLNLQRKESSEWKGCEVVARQKSC